MKLSGNIGNGWWFFRALLLATIFYINWPDILTGISWVISILTFWLITDYVLRKLT